MLSFIFKWAADLSGPGPLVGGAAGQTPGLENGKGEWSRGGSGGERMVG